MRYLYLSQEKCSQMDGQIYRRKKPRCTVIKLCIISTQIFTSIVIKVPDVLQKGMCQWSIPGFLID